MRKCVTCKKDKPATDEFFYKDKNRPLGLMYRCKDCDRVRYSLNPRVYKEPNEDQKKKHAALGKIYAKTPKGRAIFLVNAYKKQDAKRGREFNLDQAYILKVYQMPCTYCGYPSTGVDRLDNSIGHIFENCVPACKECNVARMNNFTHEETFLLGEAIKKIKDARNA